MSKISRKKTVAYARKKAGEGGEEAVASATPASDALAAESAPPASGEAAAGEATAGEAAAGEAASGEAAGEAASGEAAGEAARMEAAAAAASAPEASSPAPSAASTPAAGLTPAAPAAEAPKPADPPEPDIEPARSRTDTVAMPTYASIGAPPAMPASAAAPVAPGEVESPAHMPGPREIPSGNPDDPASPPGHVPRGDSRSMRRRAERYEFALIYRLQTFVISRVGAVGTRGVWRVVEYPTTSAASNAYAREASRFVSEGFSDYRD